MGSRMHDWMDGSTDAWIHECIFEYLTEMISQAQSPPFFPSAECSRHQDCLVTTLQTQPGAVRCMFYADTQSCTHSLQAQNCRLLLHEEATYIYRKPSECQPVSLQTFLRDWVWLGGTVGAWGDSLAVAFEVLKEKSVKVILGYVALTCDELKEDRKAYFWPRTSLHCLYSWLLLSYRSHFGIRVFCIKKFIRPLFSTVSEFIKLLHIPYLVGSSCYPVRYQDKGLIPFLETRRLWSREVRLLLWFHTTRDDRTGTWSQVSYL